MSEEKIRLLERAVNEYERIYPCGKHKLLNECFTNEGDTLMFWFNTEDQSTHLLVEELG